MENYFRQQRELVGKKSANVWDGGGGGGNSAWSEARVDFDSLTSISGKCCRTSWNIRKSSRETSAFIVGNKRVHTHRVTHTHSPNVTLHTDGCYTAVHARRKMSSTLCRGQEDMKMHKNGKREVQAQFPQK